VVGCGGGQVGVWMGCVERVGGGGGVVGCGYVVWLRGVGWCGVWWWWGGSGGGVGGRVGWVVGGGWWCCGGVVGWGENICIIQFMYYTSKVLVKGKTDSRTHPIPRSSGLKTLAKSVGRQNRPSIVRQAMHDPKIKKMVLNIPEKDVQKELTKISSKRTNSSEIPGSSEQLFMGQSPLRTTVECSNTLPCSSRMCQCQRWEWVMKKGGRKGMVACSYRPSNSAILGVCAALLLRHRNHNMNVVQRIISIILHGGHAAKQVLFV